MKMTVILRYLTVSALVGMFLAFASVASADTGPGTVTGTMINKTPNGSSVAGQEVTITTYFGQTERNKATAKVAEDGTYQFTGLSTSSSYNYQVSITYQEADYTSDTVSFGPNETVKQADLIVWDATGSDENIKTDTRHVVLDFTGGVLKVTEIDTVVNSGDKTYVGSKTVGVDKKETGRFVLPKGAKNFNYLDDLMSCCVVANSDGFSDTMAVKPGQSQRSVTYEVPYDGTTFSYISSVTRPTDKLYVYVSDTNAQASSTQLANQGQTPIEGKNYQVLAAQNMSPDTPINVALSNLPKGGNSILNRLAFPIVLVGAVGLVAGYWVTKRRQAPAKRLATGPARPSVPANRASARQQPVAADRRPVNRPVDPTRLELEKEELILAIANLDDRFESGRLTRDEYERLRAEKKERLIRTMRRQAAMASSRS